MLLAVLKMEAAPFYILDEFDHALDAQYRGAIAQLISELAGRSQFLITTFKPELVSSLEGGICEVKFANRKSTVAKINKKRALEIVGARELTN
jgi:structural maintenance of chromosome 3 (chondroitin sulfate proteoglycan 6)